jgi:predicted SAM-dependent methyltransferase
MIKLNVGCGKHYLHHRGWLDLDLHPNGHHVVGLDAAQRWPWADGTVDYVHHSHVIEHVNYADGQRMLAESYRVLRPGGRIRVGCPSLAALVRIHQDPTVPLHAAYLAYEHRVDPISMPRATPAHLFDLMFRMGGEHRFIYDASELQYVMELAGFTDVVTRNIMESDDPELQGLESVGRMGQDFMGLISLIMEGTKPQ